MTELTDTADEAVPGLIKLPDTNTIGREATSKTIREENAASTVTLGDGTVTDDALTVFNDSVMKSFTSGGNFAYDTYKRLERATLAPEPDKSYNADDFIKRNRDRIPQTLEKQYRLATSETEAGMILTDMTDRIHKQEILERRGGFSTFVAAGLAGIVDLDTPLSVLSGGAASTFKGGILATKWGRLAGSAASGALTQAGAATIGFEAGTTGDWTSIPAAGLGGMVFGIAGAGLKHNRSEVHANEAVQKAAREFDETVAEGAPLAARDIRNETHLHDDVYGTRAAQNAEEEFPQETIVLPSTTEGGEGKVIKLSDLEAAPASPGENVVREGATMQDVQGENGGSMGARQLQAQGSIATIPNQRITTMITNARRWLSRSGVEQEYNEKYSALSAKGQAGDNVAKAGARFHDALSASPLASDFDRMWRSGSSVAKRLAYDMFENASGVVRNNRSAAMLKDHYEKQLLGSFMPAYEDAMKLYAKENGLSWYDRITNSAEREKFNRQVIAELNARKLEPAGTQRSLPDSVRGAADAVDRWSATDIEIGKGRPGEGSIKGYEALSAYSGYYPQKWSGAAIEKMIRQGRKSPADITNAVSEAYQHAHGMSPEDADKYASAMVARARAGERGTDTNLIGILQQDGRDFLRESLIRNGHSTHEADKLIDKLTGEAAQRSQAAHTKGRIDVDMRFTSSNGISMMDLVDTDIARLISRRARGTSGNAALARKGIYSRMDRADIKDAILQEQAARGGSKPVAAGAGSLDKFNHLIDKDRHLTGEDIDHMFSYFDAGPVAGGLSPIYSNIKKATNLALLNQLGLTQLAETGASIAAVGLRRWFDHTGYALRGAATNPTSELVKELKHMHVLVPEEKLFRDDFNLDMDRHGPAQSDLMQKLSTVLNQGQRLQGYTSGFYAVRNFQQRIAVTSAADKIMQNMAGLAKDLTPERAADIGLDPKLYARIAKQYVNPPVGAKKRKTAIVEFKDGMLHKLNLDKWDPKDAEDFALALNRHVNQVVQKAMAGESSILFHKDGVSSLFWHLKAFPMLALEKQAGRNFRLADTETAYTFLAGLATAATAYGVKQAINGRTENLSVDKLARGAIGLSNMTGWLPMWSDPVATMLGMDALKFNTYSQGIDGNVLSTPAALTTVNKMANIAAIPGHALTGKFSNNDIRALQATPIIGNAYGFTAIFNALKD
ncbi:hypothetical protein UP09_03280 [Bradyrhizobium sp. LTSP885]|uniref:hypothetical protein n=1 Tax=Bradyrhizobium sp. LTSP885 TaxID=1619232 RepID=UPI0005C7F4C8|nr:hypothetical protein [Bradyrhizobium sp. LTSP885]KJC51082.1 hypothetical protein UP09_03280 [Bradyrhizobium sp. LTSP885]